MVTLEGGHQPDTSTEQEGLETVRYRAGHFPSGTCICVPTGAYLSGDSVGA